MPGIAAWRAGATNGSFAGLFGTRPGARVLLAMQKVEGSNPFSRFEKGLQIELFPLRTAHSTF
jgi:hypothetical protein